MEITVNNKAEDVMQKGDPGPLVDSVRENIMRRIDEVNSSTDMEINEIEKKLNAEIGEFREMQQLKHEEIIKYEGGKIRNLASTAIKKQRLDGIEAFILKVINNAAVSITKDPGYPEFLQSCVISGIENVKGRSATVIVSESDMVYSDAIIDKVSASGYRIKIKISADDRVRTGGAMVIDDDEEVIYNNSVERIFYRNKEEIRREVVRSLKESGIYREG